MITILPVHWQLTVLKVVGYVIVGGEWCDKTSIPIQCSLAGHFKDLTSGNFYELLQNFSTPGVRFGYTPVNNSGMLIDLTTPAIRWGNGNFAIDADGHMIVKVGGSFAGFNIVSVNDNGKLPYADVNISDASPLEFLSLINNADVVISNSFHATAFSIIFNKDFIIIFTI